MKHPRSAAPLILGAALVVLGLAGHAGAETRENFYPDGKLETQWEVLQEGTTVMRDGSFRRYHPAGELALQAYYRRNQPVGIWTWFDEQGNVMRRVRFDEGKPTALDNGEFLQPEHVFRDPAGRMTSQGLMKFDKPHGLWKYYFADGTLKALGSFSTGVPDGEWTYYNRNGQIVRREHYRLGILHGEFHRAYDSGQDAERGLYDQGVRSGLWRQWYVNGQLKELGTYREDQREGEWRFYAENGTLLRRSVYRMDKPTQDLPLPGPGVVVQPVIPNPDALPFLPRLYDESDRRIKRHEAE